MRSQKNLTVICSHRKWYPLSSETRHGDERSLLKYGQFLVKQKVDMELPLAKVEVLTL